MNVTSFKRILSNSRKQISRSHWIGWASVSIMTLATLILSVILGIGYVSELFLQSLENKPHIYIFFETGTNETDILDFKNSLESKENVDFVEYTSEEEAKNEFIAQNNNNNNPLIAEEVKERSLPASLAIRLISLSEADDMIDFVKFEEERNPDIFAVRYSQQTIDNIRAVVTSFRIMGIIFLILVTIVIVLFTLITVEFRTYSKSKEIEIMQLVGGSLWYIRMPFILEGGFYGVVGALISNIILFSGALFLWMSDATSSTKAFLVTFFGDLNWPDVNIIVLMIGFTILTVIIGFLIGAFNSLVAIRRYIN